MSGVIRFGAGFLALWGPRAAVGAEPVGLNAHGFWPAALDADPRDPLVVQRPQAFSAGDAFFGVLGEYASDPLIQVLATTPGDPGQQFSALDNLVVANGSLGVAIHERFRLDVAFPFVVSSTHQDGPAAQAASNGAAAGDLRLSAMAVPLRPSGQMGGGGLGVGVVGSVDLPTGDPKLFLGSGGVGGAGEIALTGEIGPATLGASVGGRVDPVIRGFPGAEGGSRATLGAAGSVLTSEAVGVGVELVGRPALVPPPIVGSGFPLELIASLRYRNPSGGFLVAGGAVGVTDAPGVPTFRLLVGGGYATEKAPKHLDFDPVGPLRSSDRCPLEVETQNGWRDDDGCPDHLGALRLDVRHGDQPIGATVQITGPDGARTETIGVGGLSIDAVPGTQWSITATEGCLAGSGTALVAETSTPLRIDLIPTFDSRVTLDVVGPDGVPVGGATASWTSATPQCVPSVPVLAASTGRISQDVGSGLPHVLVVTASGYSVVETPLELKPGEERAIRIELRPTRVKLETSQIVILDKIQFDTGKATIKSESFGLLDEVAATLLAHPQIGRVEVAGHTDGQGSDTANLKLSQDRAESVCRYLATRGVAESVLLAKGYGETAALDTNRTEVGRERNRRVEFNLINPVPATTGGMP